MNAISMRSWRCLIALGLTYCLASLVPSALGQSASGAGTSNSQTSQPPSAAPQSQQEPGSSSTPERGSGGSHWFSRREGNVQPGMQYVPPTNSEKFHGYLFDTFGPYPFLASAFAGGISQANNKPPEWGQGADAYGVRVASYFGMSMITTTTRYGLAEIFHEDTLYYRCDCHGIFPRLGHAMISTVTARRGEDGHRVFSFPALVAPYAGSMIGVAAWYPSRFEPMDGFRIGNYGLLYQAASNVALEFIYGGPHTLLSHTPLSSVTGSSSSKHQN